MFIMLQQKKCFFFFTFLPYRATLMQTPCYAIGFALAAVPHFVWSTTMLYGFFFTHQRNALWSHQSRECWWDAWRHHAHTECLCAHSRLLRQMHHYSLLPRRLPRQCWGLCNLHLSKVSPFKKWTIFNYFRRFSVIRVCVNYVLKSQKLHLLRAVLVCSHLLKRWNDRTLALVCDKWRDFYKTIVAYSQESDQRRRLLLQDFHQQD